MKDRGSLETQALTLHEVQKRLMTHFDLRSLDPQTIDAVSQVIRRSIERCQTGWQEDSDAAAVEGRLIQALQLANWSFASELIVVVWFFWTAPIVNL